MSNIEISYVMTYFNNPEMFKLHLATWHTYTKKLRQKIHFIVVDDCSTEPLVVVTNYLNLTVLRIKNDIKWNLPGARNLGAHFCTTPWMLLTDTDMLLTSENAEKLLKLDRSDPKIIWQMKQFNIASETIGMCANMMFLSRELFWEAHGYDEDFSGDYGGQEGHLRSKLFRIKGNRLLDHDVTLMHFGEDFKDLIIPDAKSSIDSMKTEEGLKRARRLTDEKYHKIRTETSVRSLMDRKVWNTSILRFNWEVVQEFRYERSSEPQSLGSAP